MGLHGICVCRIVKPSGYQIGVFNGQEVYAVRLVVIGIALHVENAEKLFAETGQAVNVRAVPFRSGSKKIVIGI